MTGRPREKELAVLSKFAALLTTHAQAALNEVDARIDVIRGRIEAARSPLAGAPTDMADADAADRWMRARQAHVATLNSALARELATREGVAREAARASAVEKVLNDARQVEVSNAARGKLRRTEEGIATPPPRR